MEKKHGKTDSAKKRECREMHEMNVTDMDERHGDQNIGQKGKKKIDRR